MTVSRRLTPGRARGIRQRLLVSALVAAMLVSGCTLAGDSSAFAPQQVEVTVRDRAFEYQGPVRPGRVVFRVHNAGTADHDVALVELPQGIADVDELLASDRQGVAPVYTTATRAPGETALFAVDLSQGRYALLGFGTDADGTPFYRKGLASEFVVGTPTSPSPTPTPHAASQ
jgi:non-ribosomal peptide synthetase component E (peptide arylation enzyme)